jgi:hypothetical protein
VRKTCSDFPGQCGTFADGCGGQITCSCAQGSPCVNGTCQAADAQCVGKPDGTACNDGNACTQTDFCQGGVCVGTNPVVCVASDQCHGPGVCNPATGVCSNPPRPNGSACNDGNACTRADTCQNGVCVGGDPLVCAPVDQCHGAGTCDPGSGTCTNPPLADGTPCSAGTCQGGICSCRPATCSDHPGQCGVFADGCGGQISCGCPTGQTCVNGVCQSTGNPCAGRPDGTPCDDGDACTQNDVCQAGVCVGGNPIVCAPLDQSHGTGTCNPATGVCSYPARANGTPCDDGNACTQGDTCQNGSCVAGSAALICDDNNVCTNNFCDPSFGCRSVPVAEGSPCPGGTCHNGVCS